MKQDTLLRLTVRGMAWAEASLTLADLEERRLIGDSLIERGY